LAGGINSVTTFANLAPGTGALFPAPSPGQYFVGTIQSSSTVYEIVHVTNVAGDVITMVRGQEGTSGQNWLAGDFFLGMPSSGQFMLAAQFVSGNGDPNGVQAGSAGSGGFGPTLYWDNAADEIWTCVTSGNAASAVWINRVEPPFGPIPDTTQYLGGDGINFFARPNLRLLYVKLTPGADNFTVPAEVFACYGEVVGAGGSGAGIGVAFSGGGGGAGGYAAGFFVVTPGLIVPITVGAGGAAAAPGADGSPGGSSSIGAFMGATGGGGGSSTANAAGGSGGQGTLAQVTIFGGPGGDGAPDPLLTGGNGGASYFGGGRRASTIGLPSPEAAVGSGGGGGYNDPASTGLFGMQGAVRIWG
jgi:hypothetical protein